MEEAVTGCGRGTSGPRGLTTVGVAPGTGSGVIIPGAAADALGVVSGVLAVAAFALETALLATLWFEAIVLWLVTVAASGDAEYTEMLEGDSILQSVGEYTPLGVGVAKGVEAKAIGVYATR